VKSSRIALAGITATAVVGLSRAVLTWLIAKEDRETQQALAHDTRVFDRRAKSYVDALTVMEPFDTQLGIGGYLLRVQYKGRTKQWLREWHALGKAIHELEARRISVIAFGSPEARLQYAKALDAATTAVEEFSAFGYSGFDIRRYEEARDEYKATIRTFEGLARRDLR
jgi:hypothetical protein